MHERMVAAERTAALATEYAEESMAVLRGYLNTGELPDVDSMKVKVQSSMSGVRTAGTLDAMRAAHTALLSQAVSLKKNTSSQGVIARELTMAEFADRIQSLGPNYVGGIDVLRYLQVHVRKISTEMMGLPGAASLVKHLSFQSALFAKLGADADATTAAAADALFYLHHFHDHQADPVLSP
eukprot:gene23545-9069_t